MSFNVYEEEVYLGIQCDRLLKDIQDVFTKGSINDNEKDTIRLFDSIDKLKCKAKSLDSILERLDEMKDAVQNMKDNARAILWYKCVLGYSCYDLDDSLLENDAVRQYYGHC